MIQKLCLSLFLSCWAFAADAGYTPPLQVDAEKYIVSISGETFGHACPISADEALTAKHVELPVMWADGNGVRGSLSLIAKDKRRDIARARSDVPFGKWFPVATRPPVEGDRVSMVGFDFGNGMTPRYVTARVVNAGVGGMFSYDKGGGGGSSGSCVLNEAGEVVGINTGFVENNGRMFGIGVLVYGDLTEIPEKFVEKPKKKDEE